MMIAEEENNEEENSKETKIVKISSAPAFIGVSLRGLHTYSKPNFSLNYDWITGDYLFEEVNPPEA